MGPAPGRLQRLLRHQRAIVLAGMAALAALAWLHVLRGAGTGMSALDMTTLSLFPHRAAALGGRMEAGWGTVLAMWWVMMVAMMTPSAAPLVLLFLRVQAHAAAQGAAAAGQAAQAAAALGSAGLLVAGYLVAWLAFSVVATALQQLLAPAGLLDGMAWWSRSAALSAAVLAAAGLYQFSALKRACLAQCRMPAQFLAAHWRPGPAGSFTLGLRHGAFCVGCCGVMMGLLFVGGVMNLAWLAVLSLMALAEKLLPGGPAVGRAFGALLLAWAAATLLVPA